MSSVSYQRLAPIAGPLLTLSVLRHGHLAFGQVISDNVRPRQGLNESADFSAPNDANEPFVDCLVHGDGHLLSHRKLL